MTDPAIEPRVFRGIPALSKELSDYIKEDQIVLDKNGEKVGSVDNITTINGHTLIKLKRKDNPEGVHRLIPAGFLEKVIDENKIQLNISAEEAIRIAKEIVHAPPENVKMKLPEELNPKTDVPLECPVSK